MSKEQFPTRKGTELFPDTIKQPVQVIFEGVEPRTNEARALFESLRGEVDAFYAQSATATSLGVIDYTTNTYATDDLQMRYVNRAGTETIYVKTRTPETPRRVVVEQPTKTTSRWITAVVRFSFKDVVSYSTRNTGIDLAAVSIPLQVVDGGDYRFATAIINGDIVPDTANAVFLGPAADRDDDPPYTANFELYIYLEDLGRSSIRFGIYGIGRAYTGSTGEPLNGSVYAGYTAPNYDSTQPDVLQPLGLLSDGGGTTAELRAAFPELDGVADAINVRAYDEPAIEQSPSWSSGASGTGLLPRWNDGDDYDPNVFLGQLGQARVQGSTTYDDPLGSKRTETDSGNDYAWAADVSPVPPESDFEPVVDMDTPPPHALPEVSPAQEAVTYYFLRGRNQTKYYLLLPTEFVGSVRTGIFTNEVSDTTDSNLELSPYQARVTLQTPPDEPDNFEDHFGLPLIGTVDIDAAAGTISWTPT